MIVLALLLQSQTVCRPVIGQVVCDTAKPTAPMDYQGIMNRAKAANTLPTRTVEQRVARQVRDGDCAGAKRTALDAGDMDLAAKAVQLCGQ